MPLFRMAKRFRRLPMRKTLTAVARVRRAGALAAAGACVAAR